MESSESVGERILAFLERIGIEATAAPVRERSFLPGMTVHDGGIVYDPDHPCPGDLLHEAGHIAVTDPFERPTLAEVSQDPGEEMAAMAWSYAAALEIGIDPEYVFHPLGYGGRAAEILADFKAGGCVGVPMLQWFGMTCDPRQAASVGLPPFPKMARWLR